jgi:hypothetical protein
MKDWTIVIPSYNRVETLKNKTLALLQKHKIPKERIHVIVADEDQAELYKAGVGDDVGKIVVGVKGLVAVRNWIFQNYPLGAPVISFDDDVKGFIEYDARARRHERPLRDLAGMFDRGFAECKKAVSPTGTKARFWGAYPSANGFFMKPGVTTDLRFIIGSFWGCFNPGKEIQVPIGGGEKEDYQRTLLFWEADGVVVRLSDVAVQTATYGTPGGLQDGNRLARERKTVKAMLKRWPTLLAPNPRRKSGYPEVRLVLPSSGKQTRRLKRG